MRIIDADSLLEEVMYFTTRITSNPKPETVVKACKESFRRMIEEQPTIHDQSTTK